MKHFAISAVLVAGLGVAATNPAQAANDGTIKIVGTVTATTCLVDGHAPGSGLANHDVDLLGVPKAQLDVAGKVGGDKLVTIRIGGPTDTNCTNGDEAYVRFDPASPNIDLATGRLNNTATTNPAPEVKIEIANLDGVAIDLANDDSAGYEIVNHETQIPLIVRMYSTGVADVGNVASEVGYQIVYN
ncbi:fimbrial protein [Stenotrophomonas rhizophila]|uniref:fimbrial protein n=1 Tax=Stenotrophomonas rhizophila TaxID=216778 RepID=UPI001E41C044|nr:hypothetical protein [Stenotrophomonas rhizophila]MCC7634560.1 type 1 fimbrial protein [Stenotrophomonas rhizophila]MCC7664171.1 type 1 fimbrial protein [Stenotrophomonas rhizophila]